MGCNCKVKSDIINLHKKYGQKVNLSFKEKLKYYILEGLKHIGVYIILTPIYPFILIYVIVKLIQGKGIFNIGTFVKKFYKNE